MNDIGSNNLFFIDSIKTPALLVDSGNSTCIANTAFFACFNMLEFTDLDLDLFLRDKNYKTNFLTIDGKDFSLNIFETKASSFDKFYSSVFNNSQSAIFFLKDSKFFHCNDYCLKLFECTHEEFIGKTPSDFSPFTQPGGLSAKHSYYLIEQARLGKNQKFKWQHLSNKGRIFWLEVNLMPVEIDNEIFVQAITNEITDLVNQNDLLKEQMHFSEAVLTSMGEALITTDTFGKITSMNSKAEKLTGWHSKLAMSQHINSVIDIYIPISGQKDSFKLEELIQSGEPIISNTPHTLKAKNGRKYTISYKATPLLDSKHKIYGSIFVFGTIDIDEDIQRALQNEHDKFVKLYKNLPESIAIYEILRDKEGNIVDYIVRDTNEAYNFVVKEKLKITNKKLIGEKMSNIYTSYAHRYTDRINNLCKTGGSTFISDKFEFFNKPVFLDIRFFLLDKDLIGMVVKDVTDLRKSMDELRKQESKLEAIYNTADQTAFVLSELDAPYRILEISPGGLNILGLKKLEEDTSVMKFHLPENRTKVAKFTEQLKDVKTLSNYEFQLQRANGTVFDALISLKVIKLEPHKNVALAAITDISVQKESQRELEKLNQNLEQIIEERTMELKATLEELETSNLELKDLNDSIARETHKLLKLNDKLTMSEKDLKHANDTKNKFFSIIGHDLKNPVHALLLSLDILQMLHKKNDRTKTDKYLDNMKENTLRLRLTLENLLSWAQSQDGKLNVKKETFFACSVINDITKITYEQANRKKITVQKELKCNMKIFADRNMIETVLRNIVTNAIKFTPNNGTISVSTEHAENFVIFKVKDNGIGMTNSELNNIFKLDSHMIKKGTNKESGSGLGLILCKEFVEKNGGQIWAESKANEGSTFYFTVPIAD